MIRALLATVAFVLVLPSTSLARNLDFQRYVHGEVRRDSYTFFCLEEKGAREIVGLIRSYTLGEISSEDVGVAIKGKTLEYKCNRQDLLHMSLKTLIKGTHSDIETVENRPIWITKDASLVKAQARDGLIVYVITNAIVPSPESVRTKADISPSEAAPTEKENPAKSTEPGEEHREVAKSIPEGPEAKVATNSEVQEPEASSTAEPPTENADKDVAKAEVSIPFLEETDEQTGFFFADNERPEPDDKTTQIKSTDSPESKPIPSEEENPAKSTEPGEEHREVAKSIPEGPEARVATNSGAPASVNSPTTEPADKFVDKTISGSENEVQIEKIKNPTPRSSQFSGQRENSLLSEQSGQKTKISKTARVDNTKSAEVTPSAEVPDEPRKTAIISSETQANSAVSSLPKNESSSISDVKMEKAIQQILDEEAKKDKRPPRPSNIISPKITDEKLEKAIQKILKEEDKAALEAPPLPEVDETAPYEGEKSVLSIRKKPQANPKSRNADENLARPPLVSSPAVESDATGLNDNLSEEEKSRGISKESIGLPEDMLTDRELLQEKKKEIDKVPTKTTTRESAEATQEQTEPTPERPETKASSSSEGGKIGSIAKTSESSEPSDAKPDVGKDGLENADESENPKEVAVEAAQNSGDADDEKDDEKKEEAPLAPPQFPDEGDAAEGD